MNDRKKELLIKASIVVAAFFGLLFIPVLPIMFCVMGKDFEEWEQLWIVSFILFAISGIVMMILIAFFKFDSKQVKGEKITLLYSNFEDLNEFVKKSLENHQYQAEKTVKINEKESMLLFRRKRKWEMDCFVILRTSEFYDDLLDTANNEITKILTEFYGTERITDWVNMTTFVCVDRINPPFQKFVNNNMEQGFKNGRLSAGFSFGGRTLYIAKQNDGIGIAKYKKLRKELLSIMSISKK